MYVPEGATAVGIPARVVGSDAVRKTMVELKKNFPAGLDYDIVYDPTIFVRDSIKAVVKTLLEAIALVVIVVILFLQTWRASIIPLAAVPVSLVGTFAVMHLAPQQVRPLGEAGAGKAKKSRLTGVREGWAWAPGYYSILFEDPDGIRLELNHVPGRGLFDTPDQKVQANLDGR